MPAWSWFVVAVVIGGALLAVAVLADRRERRREVGTDQPAPARGLPAVDRHVPSYITQDEVDALTHPAVGQPRNLRHDGEGFGFGHAHPDFATNPSGAVLTSPTLLIVDGAVDTMRELLAPLSRATADAPLVVVADNFSDDVLTTLAANRRALNTPVLAALAPQRDRIRLAELTGATPVTEADLKAGYLPSSGMGRASQWSSTGRSTWVALTPDKTLK